jgi:phospholipid/cholesterol/gamma-HCH transport system substrate-binding protein
MRNKAIAVAVGSLVTIGVAGFLFLTIYVSSYEHNSKKNLIHLSAEFSNIAGLKERSPVRIAGVKIGYVDKLRLNKETYLAHVEMAIDSDDALVPNDSTIGILTEGILGSNYLSITPGVSDVFLQDGAKIVDTKSAFSLEGIVGQVMAKMIAS